MCTVHRPRAVTLAVAAGLAITTHARAQSVGYILFGEVTSVSNPSGPWAGVAVGDPMTLGFTVDTADPATGETPTSRTFAGPFTSVRPRFATAGPHRADFFWGNAAVENLEFVIADDEPDPAPHDAFSGLMHTSEGDVRFEFVSTGTAPPVASGLSGLDWPEGHELEPAAWDTARFEITGDFGGGPVSIQGELRSVSVRSLECFQADYTEDGLIDFSDYLQFLGYYAEQDPRADLCGCGIVDFLSYLIFLQSYNRCGGA